MLLQTDSELLFLLLPILDEKGIVSRIRIFSLNLREFGSLWHVVFFTLFSVHLLMLLTSEHWLQGDFFDHLKSGLGRAYTLQTHFSQLLISSLEVLTWYCSFRRGCLNSSFFIFLPGIGDKCAASSSRCFNSVAA